MKNIHQYIESCATKSSYAGAWVLQCQSCSGSAKEKLGWKILEAESANQPTWVLWFGDGFDVAFLEKAQAVPPRGNYLGLLSVSEFCARALGGTP